MSGSRRLKPVARAQRTRPPVGVGTDHSVVPLPLCPITRQPALRRVQRFSVSLLADLWRSASGVDISALYQGIAHIGLYEAACGLFFFDPMIPGDHRFYDSFYGGLHAHKVMNGRLMERVEFRHAASLIPPGASVLDVGCGSGAFARHVQHAHYHGLDPYAPRDADTAVIRETLEAHAWRHAGTYDVVCAFQVIEHTSDPRGFAERLMRLLRPKVLLILCAPLHPSPLTEIPNFLNNVPPHHLTWWNTRAFSALAEQLALRPVEIADLPASPHNALVPWVHKFSFCRSGKAPDERYIAHRWSWHINLAVSYALGRASDTLLPMPRSANPIDVFMAARKP
jgi:SAM-dependent methyltransferase